MFHGENLRLAPVKMAGDKGDLFVELLQRVAYDTPKGTASTSKTLSHFGHFAVISLVPL